MIHLTGDSHISSIFHAAAAKWPHQKYKENLNIFSMCGGYKMRENFCRLEQDTLHFLNEEIRDNFLRHTGSATLTKSSDAATNPLFGFTVRAHPFPICNRKIWISHHLWDAAPGVGAAPLSSSLVLQIIDDDLRSTLAFYTALLKLKIPFFCIEAPALNPNLDSIVQGANKETIRAIDLLYRERFNTWLSDHNIDLIGAPDSTKDDDGYLKSAYFSEKENDVRHTNHTYGLILLDKILGYLKTAHAIELE